MNLGVMASNIRCVRAQMAATAVLAAMQRFGGYWGNGGHRANIVNMSFLILREINIDVRRDPEPRHFVFTWASET